MKNNKHDWIRVNGPKRELRDEVVSTHVWCNEALGRRLGTKYKTGAGDTEVDTAVWDRSWNTLENTWVYYFKTPQDATAFILRWL